MTDQYYFNYDVSRIDPGRYCFTDRNTFCRNTRELDEYEENVPMTPAERYALRMWVMQGHNVLEAPLPLYYLPEEDVSPSDFLDVYRMDRKLASAARRTAPDEKGGRPENTQGVLSYPKYTYHAGTGLCRFEAARREGLCRQLLTLWDYLAGEGLYSEAREYLEEHLGEELPLPFSLIL